MGSKDAGAMHSRLAEMIPGRVPGTSRGTSSGDGSWLWSYGSANRQANSVKRLSKNGFNMLEAVPELRA